MVSFRRFSFHQLVALALGVGALQCSSKSTDGDGAGGGAGLGGSAGTGGGGQGGTSGTGGDAGNGGSGADTAANVGAFNIKLIPAVEETSTPAQTRMSGKVYDGLYPSPLAWTTTKTEGDCLLRVPHAPFCDPPCAGSEVCADESSCVAFPKAQDVGSVSVRGVGASEFMLEAIGGDYQPPGSLELPYPPSAEGANIELEASGGVYAPFKLEASGIVPLELLGADPLPLEMDKPLKLEWTPGTLESARIKVVVDISHHGGQKGEIVCDIGDSGAFEIPATLVSELLGLGAAGFPTVEVSRISSDSARIAPGHVALNVSSAILRDLQIPGIVSCNEDGDCPSGQKCQDDRTCQ